MSGRYFVTGVQLAMLIASNKKDRLNVVEDIVDNQYIGHIDKIDDCLKEYIK